MAPCASWGFHQKQGGGGILWWRQLDKHRGEGGGYDYNPGEGRWQLLGGWQEHYSKPQSPEGETKALTHKPGFPKRWIVWVSGSCEMTWDKGNAFPITSLHSETQLNCSIPTHIRGCRNSGHTRIQNLIPRMGAAYLFHTEAKTSHPISDNSDVHACMLSPSVMFDFLWLRGL